MADIDQHTLSHSELIETLIRMTDVHEGKWGLVVNFLMGTGGVQLTPDTTVGPGVIVQVSRIGIQRALPGPDGKYQGLYVDAAEVNPPARAGKTKGKRRAKA